MITESSAAHRGPVVRFSIFVWYARHLVAAFRNCVVARKLALT